jgi:hypothetical protein
LKSRERKNNGNVLKKWVVKYGWYMKTLVVLHKLECEEKNLIHKMKNQTCSFGRHWTLLINWNTYMKTCCTLFAVEAELCFILVFAFVLCFQMYYWSLLYNSEVDCIYFWKLPWRIWTINICRVNSIGCGHCWNKGLF